MILTDFSNEILNLIFSFISDTNTYKQCRLSCKIFYLILKNNIVYKNNVPICTIKYFDNKISYFNCNNELEKDILFLKYGEIKTINYFIKNNKDNNFTEFNIKPPKYAVVIEQNSYFLKKMTYNFEDGDVKTTNIPRYIPHPCIIS